LLITAGPTREEIDPVRYISNHSSGKMGYAIARAAWRRGAQVILVSGPTCLPVPWGVERIVVESAEEMYQAVMARGRECTVVIKAAAVADYRPEVRAGEKLKKQGHVMTLELVKNRDILTELGKEKGARVLVGFAAETTNLLANARKKLEEKNVDLLVANDVTEEGAGFSVDTNIVRLLHRDGRVEEPGILSKEAVANLILDRVSELRRRKG
jgi:phosphopantothenoylcysteine decarboxylase/phosphopantothenate--cysteine ligase